MADHDEAGDMQEFGSDIETGACANGTETEDPDVQTGVEKPAGELKGSNNCSSSSDSDVPCASGGVDDTNAASVAEDRQPGSVTDGATRSCVPQAGYWAPVPGHRAVMKWMPSKAAPQPRGSTPHARVRT